MAKDTFLDMSTGKLVATEEDQEHLNYLEDSASTGKRVVQGYPGYPGNSGDAGTEGDPHNLHIFTNCVLHMQKVFSIVRQRYGRSPTGQMKDLDVNAAIWCIFMSVFCQAAAHLGKDYTENLRSTKNQHLKSLRQLFQVSERLWTDTLHTSFFSCSLHTSFHAYHIDGSSVCMRTSFHCRVIHDERLIVRSLLLPRSVFLRVSLSGLPLLFYTLFAL